MRKKLLVLVAVLAIFGTGYWMFLRPLPETEPQPGEVMKLEEPLLINLANGKYIKIGLALQLEEGVKELDESKALDATIALFSGQDLAEVSSGTKREQLKEELSETLSKLYSDEVMDVYFTLYVTQ